MVGSPNLVLLFTLMTQVIGLGKEFLITHFAGLVTESIIGARIRL
jgi:hypothetical protein